MSGAGCGTGHSGSLWGHVKHWACVGVNTLRGVRDRVALGRAGGWRARRVLVTVGVAAALMATPLAGCGIASANSAQPEASTGGRLPTAPPASIPPAAAGTLVSAQPTEAPAPGVAGWRITYHTRDQNGADVVATGAVLAPAVGTGGTAPAGGRPVVAFAHGTTGVADTCAPSRSSAALSALDATLDQVRAGDVVAAPDYIGLGGPGQHAIYIARPEGQALLDAARAARQLPAAHAGSKVILWGYSQGGGAVLAAGAMAASYAPDLDVRAIVGTAPFVDLERSLRTMLASPGGVTYELFAAYGVAVTDPTAQLSDDLTPRGQQLLTLALQRCAIDVLTAAAGLTTADVFRHDPLTTQPYEAAFAAQRAAAIGRMPPVLILQGGTDDVVEEPITDIVVRDLCAAGTVVDYRRYSIADHSTIFGASSAEMDAWITGQFAGKSAQVHNSCG